MGFPTPFPEPDSPELQRFAVRSRSEIIIRLRVLKEAAAPLNAFVDTDGSFGVVTLQGVDETAGKLVFAPTASDDLHERLLGAPLATLVGYEEAGKVQFAAALGPCSEGRRNEFIAAIPVQLFRLQRRGAARVRLQNARAAVCGIPLPGSEDEWEALSVLDISTGGIAVLTYPARFNPVIGSEIDGCRLDLPGVGGAVVNLRVRYVDNRPGDNAMRRCGCEFTVIPSVFRRSLADYAEKQHGQMLSKRRRGNLSLSATDLDKGVGADCQREIGNCHRQKKPGSARFFLRSKHC
jgi:hypothetical protein